MNKIFSNYCDLKTGEDEDVAADRCSIYLQPFTRKLMMKIEPGRSSGLVTVEHLPVYYKQWFEDPTGEL